MLLAARAASGTIVGGLDGTQNGSSPPNFSFWNNIGYFGDTQVGGSGIYLGDRWLITAAHVQGGNPGGYNFYIPNFNNGQQATFTSSLDPVYTLHLSPGGPGSDLVLIRLVDDPLLHTLPNIQFGAAPMVGTSVTVTGSGYNRDAILHYWDLANPSQPDSTTWTDITGSPNAKNLADRSGYFYATQPNFAKRWGTNTTVAVDAGGGATLTFNNTKLFATVFDQGVTNDSQLANGDSGGGIFVGNRLVGLNLYKGDDTKDPANPANVGQPANTAVFDNASFYANLYDYVDEIASITKLHPSIDGDANLDGIVDTADFKILYSNLGKGTTWTDGDFNLDGKVDFADFQRFELNFGASSFPVVSTGINAAVTSVPEPGGLGIVALAMAIFSRRPRRIG